MKNEIKVIEFLKYTICVICFACVIMFSSVVKADEEVEQYFNVVEKTDENIQNAPTAGSKFDVRSKAMQSMIRNQGNTEACGYCSANATVEYSIRYQLGKKNYEGALEHLIAWAVNELGANLYAMSSREIGWHYYTSGFGPISYNSNVQKNFESRQLDYASRSNYVTSIETEKREAEYQIGEITKYMDLEVSEIKEALKKHGALQATCQMVNDSGKMQWYNSVTKGSYTPKTFIVGDKEYDIEQAYRIMYPYEPPKEKYIMENHAITVIGWDDNYSKDNFKVTYINQDGKIASSETAKPKNNGAWIIQNSYGEAFGDKGIFYISYEDFILPQILYGVSCIEKKNYNTVYERAKNEANNFVRSCDSANIIYYRDNVETAEYLTQVAVKIADEDIMADDVDIYINQGGYDSREEYYEHRSENQKIKSVTGLKSGNYIIKLDNPIELINESFQITVVTKSKKIGFSTKYSSAVNNKMYLILNGNMEYTDLTLASGSPYIIAYTEKRNDVSLKVESTGVIKNRSYSENNNYAYEIKVRARGVETGTSLDVKIFNKNKKEVTSDFEIEGNEVQNARANIKIKAKDNVKPENYIVKIYEQNSGNKMNVITRTMDLLYKVNRPESPESENTTSGIQKSSGQVVGSAITPTDGNNKNTSADIVNALLKNREIQLNQSTNITITPIDMFNDVYQNAVSYRNKELSYEAFKETNDLLYYSTTGLLVKEDKDEEKDAHVEYKGLIDRQVNQITAATRKLKSDEVNEKAKDDPFAQSPYGPDGTVTTKSNTIARYTGTKAENIDAQEAYILAHVKDLDWDSCKAQEALLRVRAEKQENTEGEEREKEEKVEGEQVVNNLYEESKHFKEYTEKLQQFKEEHDNKVLVDLTDYSNINRMYDDEKKAFLAGPFKVDYIKDIFEVNPNVESEVASEDNKIVYGGITDLTVYADSRKEQQLNYRIIYLGGNEESKTELESLDNEFVPSEISEYKYPEPNEEFYLEISNITNEGAAQAAKMVFTVNTMKAEAQVNILQGTYQKINWISRDKEIKCVQCGKNLICKHGNKTAHVEGEGQNATRCLPKYCGVYYEKTGELREARDGHLQGHEFYLEAEVEESNAKAPDLVQITTAEIWKATESLELAIGTESEGYFSYSNQSLTPKFVADTTPAIRFLMDINGNVFGDNKISGTEFGDGLKNGESGIGNVEVFLYSSNGVIAKTLTDSSGNYTFKDVKAGDNYSVNFAYDGMKYQCTKNFGDITLDSYNTSSSHATENETDRTEFNNTYTEHINDALISDKAPTLEVDYKKNSIENGTESSLMTTYNNGDAKKEFKITARTDQYPLVSRYSLNSNSVNLNGQEYSTISNSMDNVNLGLVEREQGKITLKQDVYQVAFTFQQETNIIKNEFGKRLQGNSNEPYNIYINEDDWNWRHDFVTSNLVNKSDELQGYVTYKIVIKNEAKFDYANIPELVTHYDTNMSYSNLLYDRRILDSNSWYVYRGVRYNMDWATSSKYDRSSNGLFSTNFDYIPGLSELPFISTGLQLFKQYNSMYSIDLNHAALAPGEEIEVYVTYKIKKDANRALFADKNNGGARKHVTEINSYDYQNGKVSLGTNPGNANPSNPATFEDDTDAAPDLYINVKIDAEGRTLTGYVWEDKRVQTLANNKVIGNGIRENGEMNIDNVKVDLVPMVWNPSTKQYEETSFSNLYPHRILGRTANGYYKFANLAGGMYKIRYTYGDEEQLKKNVDRYIPTKYNGHDYQSTTFVEAEKTNKTSKARDNEVTGVPNSKVKGRNSVLEYSKVMTYANSEVLDVEYINSLPRNNAEWNIRVKTLADNTTMTADSVNCNFNIRELKYEVPEINLGLSERPEQKIVTKDEVENIQIILADGTELINVKAGLDKNVQKIANEKLIAYMDEEIMEGATINITYKITVSNEGEIDTLSSYYRNGTTSTIPTQIATVYSHYDNQIFRAEDNSRVYILNKNGQIRKETGLWKQVVNLQLQNKVREQYLSRGYKTIETESLTGINLYPAKSIEVKNGEQISEVSIYLTLSKVISGRDEVEGLEYDNYIEVVKRISDSGRRDYNGVAGNYVAGTEIVERDTAQAANVSILPPFGMDKTTYFAIAIVSLALAGIGVVFILRKIII